MRSDIPETDSWKIGGAPAGPCARSLEGLAVSTLSALSAAFDGVQRGLAAALRRSAGAALRGRRKLAAMLRADRGAAAPGTAGRTAAGSDVQAVWTLTGVALLAACAHDGAGLFGTGSDAGSSGGGYTNEEETHWPILAAIIALSSFGGGGGGGGGVNRAPRLEDQSATVRDTAAVEPDSHRFTAMVEGGAQASALDGKYAGGYRFDARDPEGDDLEFYGKIPGSQGAASVQTPTSKYDAATFNFNRMLEGEHGTLYYNSRTGVWNYEVADVATVNSLGHNDFRYDYFEISATDAKGAQSQRPGLLTITIAGANEQGEGTAEWAVTAPIDDVDPVKAGDQLTVTLRDPDDLPQANAITYFFFQDDDAEWSRDDDYTNDGWTEIDSALARVIAANTGVVDVSQEHVGKHIGVRITYTDRGGNEEDVVAYATATTGAVTAFDAPGQAAFDQNGLVGGGSATVRLRDANGLPDNVTYNFFHTSDPAGMTDKTPITPTPPVTGTTAAANAAGLSYNSHATLMNIPTAAVGRYLGVDISYDDGVLNQGDAPGTGDTALAVSASPVGEGALTMLRRNYGPEIAADLNRYHEYYYNILSTDRAKSVRRNHDTETDTRHTLVFGERGYRNDPEHTPNNELVLSFENVVSATLQARAAVVPHPANPRTGTIEDDYSNPTYVDSTYYGDYGNWRFYRINSHSQRGDHEIEAEGVLHWDYTPGQETWQRTNLEAIGASERVIDHMFIQISDGRDTDIERLTVDIRGTSLPDPGAPARHVEDPATGAAPTLVPDNYHPGVLSTNIYPEGFETWSWERLNKHQTDDRRVFFGDEDTNDADLKIAYHHTWYRFHKNDFLGDPADPTDNGDRTLLDMPGHYLTPDYFPDLLAVNAAAIHPYHAGDVALFQWNQVVNNPEGGFQTVHGRFGNFYFKRHNNPSDLTDYEEQSAFLWSYGMFDGNGPSFATSSHEQHKNIQRLYPGEWGVDALFFQVYDDEGNRSDVRGIYYIAEGNREAEIPARGNGVSRVNHVRQYTIWEDLFNPALKTAQAGPAFPVESLGDASQDVPPPVDYDIV